MFRQVFIFTTIPAAVYVFDNTKPEYNLTTELGYDTIVGDV